MPEISSSYKEFSRALKHGEAVNVTKNGHWYIEGWFMRIIRWLFDLHGPRVRNVINTVTKIFDEMQKTPVDLNGDFTRYKMVIKVAKAAQIALREADPLDYLQLKSILERRIIALSYWAGPGAGGFVKDAVPNAETLKKVTEFAAHYKKSQWQFSEEKNLHPADHKYLRETAHYPEFVKRLGKDPELCEEFFSHTIRYFNSPGVFIEHPPVVNALKDSFVSGWMGRSAHLEPLKMRDDGHFKTITMAFGDRFGNKKDFNILDPQGKVAFPGEPEIFFQAVLDDMRNTLTRPSEYNFIDGMWMHYNIHSQSYYNPVTKLWDQIPIDIKKWYEALPGYGFVPIAKVDVMARCELENLEDGQFVLLFGSAKQSEETRFDNCHGLSDVYVPNDDGTWNFIDFGKYPKVYPTGAWNFVWFITDTIPADGVSPDYNGAYSAIRQHARFVKVTDKAGGGLCLELIRQTLQLARDGKLYFQFGGIDEAGGGGGNCADEVQRWAEGTFGKESEGGEVPQLFLAPITDAGCKEPLDTLLAMARDLPEEWGDALLLTVSNILQSDRGFEVLSKDGKQRKLSMKTSPFHEGIEIDGKKKYCHIQLPSKLHERIKNGEVPGIIWSGFQRMMPKSWIESDREILS